MMPVKGPLRKSFRARDGCTMNPRGPAEPRQIVHAVRDSLERIPPELWATSTTAGVVTGARLLRNLDQRSATRPACRARAENPLMSWSSAREVLSDLPLLKKVFAVAVLNPFAHPSRGHINQRLRTLHSERHPRKRPRCRLRYLEVRF